MRIVFILLCGFYLTCSNAQISERELEKFNISFADNIEKLRNVYNFRGASFICDYGEHHRYEHIVFRFLEVWDSAPRRPALIFYSKTEDSLFAWLFADGQMHYHGQKLSHESLIAMERNLRNAIRVEDARGYKKWKKGKWRGTNISLKKGQAKQWNQLSEELSSVLIPENFRPYLMGKGHLFVLPELNIGQIPFWLLRPFGNQSILADSMSFSFVPHVCGFTEFVEKNVRTGTSGNMQFHHPLIIGNPDYAGSLGLQSLPGAAKEAETVAGLLHSRSYSGKEAGLSWVRSQMQNADLYYFATHASCSLEDVLNQSWIAFAPDNYSDGRMYLKEIQRMMTDAELAVLSACQTGYGLVLEGGFVGLGRAFFKSGVKFTVMSLWSVNDQATSDLMVRFTEEMMKPGYFQPAEPLRKAVLMTREKYPHPAFWAPFVLFGFTY